MSRLPSRTLLALATALASAAPLSATAQAHHELRVVKQGLVVANPPSTPAPETPVTPPPPAGAPTAELSATSITWDPLVQPVSLGGSDTQSVLLANHGNAALQVSPPSLSGSSQFGVTSSCNGSLAPGLTCSASVTYSPTAYAAAEGTLTFNTSAGNRAVTLSALPAYRQAVVEPTAGADFGSVLVGSSGSLSFTLTNTGSVPLTQVYARGNDATLATASSGCGTQASPLASLAPGASCGITATWTPATIGAFGAAVVAMNSTGVIAQKTVTGTGLGPQFEITGNPASTLPFVTTNVGTASPTVAALSLKNSGNLAGTFATPSLGGANPGDFQVSTNTCTSSVAINGTCTLSFSFTPTSNGARQATVSVLGQTFTLTGTATSPTTGDGVSKAGACASGAATGCATWNSAKMATTSFTLSNSNLTYTRGASSGWGFAMATVGKSTGKWYWEVSPSKAGSINTIVGVATATSSTTVYPGSPDTTGLGVYAYNGGVYRAGLGTGGSFASYTGGDVIGFAFDADVKSLRAYKNGTLVATYTYVTNVGALYPAAAPFDAANSVTANFGQSSFKYAPPAGYNAGLW